MQRLLVCLAVAGGLLAATSARADTVTMHMNSDTNSVIQFNGRTDGGPANFTFQTLGANPKSYASFTVNLLNDDALPGGLTITGTISGLFSIGAVSGTPLNQSAPVSTVPLGALTLKDNLGGTLTGNVFFTSIYSNGDSSNNGDGYTTAGGLMNLTGITYTGSGDTYFQTLADNNAAQILANFQWPPSKFKSLSQLTADGASNHTNFQLSLTDPVAPAPASWALLASGTGLLSGFGAFRRRRWLFLA